MKSRLQALKANPCITVEERRFSAAEKRSLLMGL